MEQILKVENINVYYGAIHAIKGISFHVDEGEIVTLIGANGAGKSTTLQTISGLIRSRTGGIEFCGESISKLPPHRIVEKGLAHVPEGRRIFLQMSVQENLEMGAFTQSGGAADEDLEKGLLMLDEPSMGLAPILVEQIFEIIQQLHRAGTTILLVEQNAQMALSVADRAYVMETGCINLSGTGRELAESDRVKKAYLGG